VEAGSAVGSTREGVEGRVTDLVGVKHAVTTSGAFAERVTERDHTSNAAVAIVVATDTKAIAFFSFIEETVTATCAETGCVRGVELDATIARVVAVKVKRVAHFTGVDSSVAAERADAAIGVIARTCNASASAGSTICVTVLVRSVAVLTRVNLSVSAEGTCSFTIANTTDGTGTGVGTTQRTESSIARLFGFIDAVSAQAADSRRIQHPSVDAFFACVVAFRI